MVGTRPRCIAAASPAPPTRVAARRRTPSPPGPRLPWREAAPKYDDIHEALREELSPSRLRDVAAGDPARLHTAAPAEPAVGGQPDGARSPELCEGGARAALASLLAARGQLAAHYRHHLAQPDAVAHSAETGRVLSPSGEFLLSPLVGRDTGTASPGGGASAAAVLPHPSGGDIPALPPPSGGAATPPIANIEQILGSVASILEVDPRSLPSSLLADTLEPLPDVYFSSPKAAGDVWNTSVAAPSSGGAWPSDADLESLSPRRKALLCKEQILRERPWLEGVGSGGGRPPLDAASAAAAAHLLLYAEGIQGMRELHYTMPQKGREVTSLHDIPRPSGPLSGCGLSPAVPAGVDGVVISSTGGPGSGSPPSGGPHLLTIRFDLRADGVSPSIPVPGIPAGMVRVKHRRVIPLEAVQKWGPRGARFPSVAAHIPASEGHGSSGGVAGPPAPKSLNSVLQPLIGALGVPGQDCGGAGVGAVLRSVGSDTTAFDAHLSTGFPVRASGVLAAPTGEDGAAGRGGMDSRQYNSVVGLIGRYVMVVDDPLRLRGYCAASFASNVDADLAVRAAGRVGKLAEVNIAAETARVVIYGGEALAPWLPLQCLSLRNKDPLLALGARQTSITVWGGPSSSDIRCAARAIAVHESQKRRERRQRLS